jgi:hypothetical protein
MTPIRKPAPAFVGVVAGQVATLDLPIGKTYHAIYLAGTVKNTGQPPAITDIFGPGPINVKRNGKIQRQHLVTELDALNAFDKEDLRSNFYGATGQIQGQLTMPTLVVGTSASFAVGDIIGYTGGTVAPGGQQAQFICVTAGGLTTANWRVKNPGQYSVAPTSTTPVIISSAAGTIGTGTVTPSLSLMTSLLPNGLGLSGSAAYAAITPYTGDTSTKSGINDSSPMRSTSEVRNPAK